jgi:hypothetical protein
VFFFASLHAMHTCIFCGAREPVHCKHLLHAFVWEIVQRQKEAGMSEPIVDFLCSYITAEMHKPTTSNTIVGQEAQVVPGLLPEKDADDSDIDAEYDDGGAYFNSCMCCYYWVSRRQKHQLVPLPMQNLLWYVRTLMGCEKKKCDSRLLLRLVKTITESGNMYARFFEPCELRGMLAIKELSQHASAEVARQGESSFCVKKQLAALWHSNNGESILIGHAHAADLLR